MTVADLPARYLRVKAGLALRDKDPLRFWKFAVEQSKEAVALFTADEPIEELYIRAANKAGKTETAGAVVLAMLQKRPSLDGVPLPQWRGPVSAKALSLDYNEQKAGSQQTIIRLLGQWPHHAKWKGDDILSSVRIQPVNGSSDKSTWSTLTFHSEENKRAGVGRADILWPDEPPDREIWHEARKAAHANRPAVRIISATPTLRRLWWWLKDEYGYTARNTLRRVSPEWAEIVWSLIDDRGNPLNRALSRKEVDKLLAQYWGPPDRKTPVDPLYDARVHGDYIDASGLCPFDIVTLQSMLAECSDPLEVWEWNIPIEDPGPDGLKRTGRLVDVEVFEKPEANARYYCTIDPSAGIDDGQHDPYELEMTKIGSGNLVLRCGGYLAGKLVGILGAGLCKQYNYALADPEVNDRWGVNVVEGFHAAGYGNFAREPRELRPGEWGPPEIGFHNTAKSRPAIIGAVQSWIESWRAGVRYGRCPSRFVIQTLLDCILDHAGKIVAAPGFHDEALICRGQGLRRAVTRSSRPMPELYKKPKSPDSELAALIQGRSEPEIVAPFGQRARRAIARPRM